MNANYTPKRAAFSLIELLVVVAILAILFGLLLSAVQHVRTAAVRLSCGNKLRQHGLALHQLHDAGGSFPAGVVTVGVIDKRFIGWQVRLLPYLEQAALAAEADRAMSSGQSFSSHPPLSATPWPAGCPADPRVTTAQPYLKRRVGLTSYLGVSGHAVGDRLGMLFADSAVRLTDATDGTGSTLLVGERPASRNHQFGWWYGGVGQAGTGSADVVLGASELNKSGNGVTLALCAPGPYRFQQGDPRSNCSAFHFWSLHSGGAHFAFADGSVRFLSYSAADVLPALATRAGGEVAATP